ncbi:MAG: hypothetical protein MJE63_33225, partial [Proteobacteria bacterium]|nr:hypothetical protein [Pseudomonadota bacterium]
MANTQGIKTRVKTVAKITPKTMAIAIGIKIVAWLSVSIIKGAKPPTVVTPVNNIHRFNLTVAGDIGDNRLYLRFHHLNIQCR